MQLEALHHITMITSDATENVRFYAETLGLRLVKQTVNFDDPHSYHLYFGDETGAPGSILTWFEIRHAAPGRPGAGTIHEIQLGVRSVAALDFWQARLTAAGVPVERDTESLLLHDPDGLVLRLVTADDNPPLIAAHPEIPATFAITGAEGARAYTAYDLTEEDPVLTEVLGFSFHGEGVYTITGSERRFRLQFDVAPIEPGRPGAGTVHHIAWSSRDEDHLGWQDRLVRVGARVSPVMDRDYFRSIYFREPQGVLFEIATLSPGFAADEDPSRLGEELRLPAMHQHLHDVLEQSLTPLRNPRQRVAG
jgi:glyoxalase family protein